MKMRLMEFIYEGRSCRCVFHYMDWYGLEPSGPTTSPAMRSCDKLEIHSKEFRVHFTLTYLAYTSSQMLHDNSTKIVGLAFLIVSMYCVK
jgi:hypothetical protein